MIRSAPIAYEKIYYGGGAGILTMGVMLARYRSLALLIIFVVSLVALLGVSDHYEKKPNPIPCPH